jgi:uncharacterized protein (TIGR02284 family)
MEDNKKTVDELNQLVEINNDRIEGYKTALKETNETDLKQLFTNMAEHSSQFKNELAAEVTKLGGEPKQGTTNSGKVYRAWMDVKAALTRKDRKAIIKSCEFGEDAALETYDKVLTENHLQPALRDMIMKQKEAIRQDHDKIKSMAETIG